MNLNQHLLIAEGYIALYVELLLGRESALPETTQRAGLNYWLEQRDVILKRIEDERDQSTI